MFWSGEQLVQMVAQYILPFCRIAALLMVAPVFGANLVPRRIKIVLAVGMAAMIVPLLPPVDTQSFPSVLQILQEITVGVAMGFVVQIVFDAMVLGGQTAAMSMGLGFAFFLDPQRGVNVPIVSQFFLIMTTLVFLSINGHLVVIAVLFESFASLPVGGGGIGEDGLRLVISQGTKLFMGAVQMALPAVIAILSVNIAFGVVSRAAPTLNLFAVGFPVTMLLGFLVLLLAFNNLGEILRVLFDGSFDVIRRMVGA